MTLPTPVLLAGAVACAAAGFLAGAVTAPGGTEQTTAEVQGYEPDRSRLCLVGDAVDEWSGDTEDGVLCGVWRRTPGSPVPVEGDTFRFVAVQTEGDDASGEKQQSTVIYGDVVE